MAKNVSGRMFQRRGATTDWETQNPMLSEGEIGYDTTHKRIKIGDGTNKWNNLPYLDGQHYVACTTAANVKAKEVIVPGFEYKQGARLIVFFLYGNTVSQPTLYVKHDTQSLGAMPISLGNDRKSGLVWKAGETLELIVDLNHTDGWRIINGYSLADKPVGTVYMSTASTSPASLFGGSWTQIKDRFLLGVGDTYKTPNLTAGSETHSHTLENGYAKLTRNVDGNAYYKRKTTENWQPNFWAEGTDTQFTSFNSWALSVGTELGGSTDDIINLPPYHTVYMWRRTA